MRWGMAIDLRRCIGCYGCQLACKAEHGTPPGVFFARVIKQEEGAYPLVRQLFLPVLCNHCENPPCVEACPTGASHKHAADGIVDIDHDLCVGCRACMMACPYSNRYFNDAPQAYFEQGPTPYEARHAAQRKTGVVMKCNFCRDRVRAGKLPACVANCPTVARTFGDLDDPTAEISRLIKSRSGFTLHPELGTSPSVYYLPP